MQKHRDITLHRLEKFKARLVDAVYGARCPVQLTRFAAPGRISFEEAMQGTYEPLSVPHQFGPVWSTHWIHVQVDVPADWAGKAVHFLWNSGCEACVWDNGSPVQGMEALTHRDYPWTDCAAGGEHLELYLEVAVNCLFGAENPTEFAEPPRDIGTLCQAEIGLFVPEAWDLLWDFAVVSECAQELAADSRAAGQAMRIANEMINLWDPDDRNTWAAARALAAEFLSQKGGEGRHEMSVVGHAHIDTAWLWPIAETKRKCNRSFSTSLALMDRYPEFKFVCPQAQQWQYVKENVPEFYERMRTMAAEGRFLAVGGSWVEPDCNVPSGEALVRQFLYGQRFFEQEVGSRSKLFWNPDVFGYSAQLPQILRGVGIEWFLTQKLSWNQTNQFPHHTFVWEGLDGSSVLTHFPPADTYHGNATVKQILHGQDNFRDHSASTHSYYLFGYGDGGGGPNSEMLERLRRMKDVDGLPKLTMRTPDDFFEGLEKDREKLLTWVGELYLELHRGTYTTQAETKKSNRKGELLLRDLEFLYALSARDAYPQEQLEELWKLVLLNQFHDILPGSSINEVYVDARADYAVVFERGGALLDGALNNLAGQGSERVLAVNTLSHDRREVVDLATGPAVVSVPSMGYSIGAPESVSETVQATQTDEGFVLENDRLRALFAPNGQMVSLFDKRVSRETVEAGESGNKLILFDDRPNKWDAWDVDPFHLEKPAPAAVASSVSILEAGPLRAALRMEFPIGKKSSLVQTVSLTAVSSRIDFDTQVDWHEDHQFLKVEFPWAIRSSQATYEMQFGHLQRPTHSNTSWDMAQFEVCMHRWADLSEPDYGVAVLNDCKYGCSTHGNRLQLSLLRAPTYPDPEADRGEHRFTYAVYPHVGSLQDGGVIEEAERLNSPLLLQATDRTAEIYSWFQVSHPSIKIDTVKRAEDSGDLVLRLYEAHGTTRNVRVESPLPIREAVLCNMLEDEGETVDWAQGIALNFTPFEIKTVKLKLDA